MLTMTRIMASDRLGNPLGDLDPGAILDATYVEEINGENAITITTTQELEKTTRLLLRDGMGLWREYVVCGIEEGRTEGGAVSRKYWCPWSLQYDLSATYINDQFGCGVVPGKPSVPQPAHTAMECALAGTTRWGIGSITVTTQAAASFYRRSGWDGMATVVERWGGEIRSDITVSATGVASRAVSLLDHLGNATPTRRFDYGADVTGIRRVVSDDVWPCRIVPLGKSQETDAGGYTRRPGIEGVNGGVPWVEDAQVVPLVRVPDGNGGWEYPTAIVKNDTYEDPADLKAWAVGHVSDYTRPVVSYEADVAQLERAGMSPHGVGLGDEVVVVDRDFLEGGLRISARVVRITGSLLDPADTKLTISNTTESLTSQLRALTAGIAELADQTASASQYQSTAAYLTALLGRLNDEANSTGGYTYITEGEGIRTYDVAVSDPLVGAEATKVVEVKGGTIRIANSRTSGGDWNWRTVFASGYVAADVLTANNITTGTMSADHIKGGTLQVGGSNNVNGIIQVLDANGNVISRIDNTGAYITGEITSQLAYTPFLSTPSTKWNSRSVLGLVSITDYNLWTTITGNSTNSPAGYNLGGLTIMRYDSSHPDGYGKIMLTPPVGASKSTYWSAVYSTHPLRLFGNPPNGLAAPFVEITGSRVRLAGDGNSLQNYVTVTSNGTAVTGDLSVSGNITGGNIPTISVSSTTATVGSAAASIGTNSVRRYGKVVMVTLANIQLASAISNGSYSGTIATVPSGYRPAANVYGACFAAGANLGGSYARITNAGVVAIRNQSGSSIAASTSVLPALTITYIID